MRSLAASLLLLAGCAAQEVRLPEVVKVPVPVPCIDVMPAPPEVEADADLIKLDDYQLVLTLGRDRQAMAEAYGKLRAVAQACVR